jgi:hypothetical protein
LAEVEVGLIRRLAKRDGEEESSEKAHMF